MSDTAIRVENISKRYQLGRRERYKALRDTLTDMATAPFRAIRSMGSRKSASDEQAEADRILWALRDVSFEVKQGEAVGIIGRNGAGKSTLLKVLSRITEPTEGLAEIRGRVGSLLEVGTGFHPELSGRENIYLNGAILGMRRAEIERKFDEIVAFAEVEKFIDTPVKRYSSGMYVRLAFAVAAHLEPEIMLVDEVLAVGDAAFQKKCLGKMGDVARQGRTVLFVSHNMAAVDSLCQRGVVLERGQVKFIGTQTQAIGEYLKGLPADTLSIAERTDRRGNGAVRVTGIELRDTDGQIIDTAASGQALDIYFYFEKRPDYQNRNVVVSMMFKTQMDMPVFLHHNRLTLEQFGVLPEKGAFVCRISELPLPASMFRLGYSVMADEEYLDTISDAIEVNVIGGNFFGSGEVPPISHGVCLVHGSWRLEGEGG